MRAVTSSGSPTRKEIADALDQAIACREELATAPLPGLGSPASADFDGVPPGMTASINRLITVVDLWLTVATDQVHGLAILIRDGTTVFSLFPTLRSILEHSSAIVWVLEGDDHRVRAARASLMALRGQEELAKAASRLSGKGSLTHQDQKRRLMELRAEITAEFGSLVLEPLSLEGETLPSPTDLVTHFGGRWGDDRAWTGAYDYLCGTANHPALSAYEYFNAKNPTGRGPEISLDVLRKLLSFAVVPYLKALEYVQIYLGLPEKPVEEYIDRINATVGEVLS